MKKTDLTTIKFYFHAILLVIATLLVASCGGGGGGSAITSSGLTLRITDAPADDLQEVWITFTEAVIHPKDAPDDGSADIVIPIPDEFASGASIELTSLSGGDSVMLLQENPIPAGEYAWIRLALDLDPARTYVVDSIGAQHGLTCSSCEQSGFKLNREFTIDATGLVDFTIDFDLRKSITLANNIYKLRPTLRILDTELASSQITGSVLDQRIVTPFDPLTPADGCFVYIYEGDATTVTPDDLCSDPDVANCPVSTRPLTTAEVTTPDSGVTFEYITGFLEPALYTATLVCESDDPDIDEELTYITPVTADATTPGLVTLPDFILGDTP